MSNYMDTYIDKNDCKSGTKTYFMLRPTISSGRIKGKNDVGLFVSIGYNYVPEAKLLNGFIPGIGLKFIRFSSI